MSTFNVELKKIVDDSYEIEIGFGLEEKLIADIKNGLVGNISKFAVITDSIVKDLYAVDILNKLKEAGFYAELFVFEAGETSIPDSWQHCLPNHPGLFHNFFFHIKRITAFAASVHIPVHRQPFRLRRLTGEIIQFHIFFFQNSHMEFRQYKIFLCILAQYCHIGSEHASVPGMGDYDRTDISHGKNNRDFLKHNLEKCFSRLKRSNIT